MSVSDDAILLTEAEAAQRLRLSTRTLRKARAEGHLRYVLIGRAVRYTIGDLESYVETLRSQPAPCPAPSSKAPRVSRRSGSTSGTNIVSFSARAARR